MYQRSWRQAQYLASLFWRRWIDSYLPELQRRQKRLADKPNLRVGDLVLITSEKTPRSVWPLGRILSTTTDAAGVTRSCDVKTVSSTLTRPVNKLVLLEQQLYK